MNGQMTTRTMLCTAGILLWLASAAGAAVITVSSPNGGETWIKGNTYVIRWSTSRDLAGERIVVSLRQGANPAKNLTGPMGVENTGTFSWTIPAGLQDIPAGPNYKIRVKTKEANDGGRIRDESDASFTIANPGPPPGIGGANTSPPTPTGLGQGIPMPEMKSPSELAILRVDPVGNRPLHIGDTIPIIARVSNSGGKPATIYLASIGEGPGLVEKLTDPITLSGHTSRNIEGNLTIRRSNVRGDYFRTSVFLADPNASGAGVFQVIWKDSNKDDNTIDVKYVVLTRIMVSVQGADRFRVQYTGDPSKEGELLSANLSLQLWGLNAPQWRVEDRAEVRYGKIGNLSRHPGLRSGKGPSYLEIHTGDNLAIDFGRPLELVVDQTDDFAAIVVGANDDDTFIYVGVDYGKYEMRVNLRNVHPGDECTGMHVMQLSGIPGRSSGEKGPVLVPLNGTVCFTWALPR